MSCYCNNRKKEVGNLKEQISQLQLDVIAWRAIAERNESRANTYQKALIDIERFGHSNGHGRGYTCATKAEEALRKEEI